LPKVPVAGWEIPSMHHAKEDHYVLGQRAWRNLSGGWR